MKNCFPDTENLALVLEGGGAKGAYHVGVVKALMEAGYRFSIVTGTSIGALNAAILIQDGIEKLGKFWHDVRISDIMEFDDAIAEKLGKQELDSKTLSYLTQSAVRLKKIMNASSCKMEKFVKLSIDEEKIRKSSQRLGFVTYSVSKMSGVEKFADEIESGKLADYLIASATFPLYGFYEIDGEKYIDGGVWDNVPINLAASGGAKYIIAVRTSSKVRRRKIVYPDLNIDYIIPSENLGRTMVFLPDRIARFEKVGYYDARRYIHGYFGCKYYIEPFDGQFFEESLCVYCADKISRLSEELALPFMKSRTPKNLEGLALFIREKLGLGEVPDSEAILALFEYFAPALEIERLEVYTLRDFIKQISVKLIDLYPDCTSFLKSIKDIRRHSLGKILYAFALELKEKL